jgi:midasin (ATPase involved in ribosome maturation)
MQQIETEPHGHFAICGPQACGKMSFVKYAMQLYSKKYHQQQQMIVVTCEETFDTKNLVGTYVCSETGDFVFKKGPLTVAAEQGLWLVLKNIEDTPSDLLSFLLPLVQQNRLQVTSTFTIVPKLGFRMFCLSKSRTAQEIQPLLSCLHSTELETLYKPGYPGRVDLSDILLTKFPSLFIPIGSYSIHQLVQAAIENIHLQMQTMKLNLLDYKVQSVTDLFSLYKRLHLAFNSQDLTHMSQAIRQHIIEEISDVYLGYMYDTVVKKRAISNMVREVFNHD